MMIEAVLFDLDDTLLGNNMVTFVPGYFALLGKHAQRYMDQDQFLQELMICTQGMMTNTDTAVSNRDVFWGLFQQRTGLDPDELEPFFDQFYRNQFPQLAPVAQMRPVAIDLVRDCFTRGLKVIVATNPMFPRTAIEERLNWAGVPVTEFAYDLVTTYENMHTTKPHQAYYLEILERIGCVPESALMVGDDWTNDMAPTAELGMSTYWITPDDELPPDQKLVDGYGSLAALYGRISSGWLDQLTG